VLTSSPKKEKTQKPNHQTLLLATLGWERVWTVTFVRCTWNVWNCDRLPKYVLVSSVKGNASVLLDFGVTRMNCFC